MNLVEKLLRADKAKLNDRETKTIKSKRLSKILGEDAEITIRQIPGRRMDDLNQTIYDEDGEKDLSKGYDLNILYCTEGIIDPPVKDARLMEYFNAPSPDILVEKLFDAEAAKIAGEIVKLSGLTDDAEGKVKNS